MREGEDTMMTTTIDVEIVMAAIRSRDIKRKTPAKTMKEASHTEREDRRREMIAIRTIATIEIKGKIRRKL